MPVRDGVGVSVATREKQYALDKTLRHVLGAACAVAVKHRAPIVIGDMTAGPGADPVEGQDGSPLIIARHVSNLRARGHDIRLICVERSHLHRAALQSRMQARFPGLPVEYFAEQSGALASIPANARGLTYWDPNRYKELDHDRLKAFGRSHRYMDILITRECLAAYRMLRANVAGTIVMRDYLTLTGKRCNYIMQYSRHGWWSLGFADNWEARPVGKMSGMVRVDSPEGQELCRLWANGGTSKTINVGQRVKIAQKPMEEQTLWQALAG